MRGNNVLALRNFFILSWLALYVLSIDPGKLGIVWNEQLVTEPAANPRHKHAWLSIAEFDKNVVDIFSDEEIAGLAKLGHEDMMKEFKSDNPPWRDPRNNIPARQPKKAPVAMTLIVSGKRIYAASSVRGGGIAYTPYATAKVREALIQCQMETAGHTPHRTTAGCGEPMAAHLAFESGLTSLNGAKVITYGQPEDSPIGIMHPCGLFDRHGAIQDRWGCNAFTRDLGLFVIPENTRPRDKTYSPDPRIIPVCI